MASSTSCVTQMAVICVRLPDVHQHFLQVPARQRIEHAEGLIEQQQLGRQRERARQTDALASCRSTGRCARLSSESASPTRAR